MDLKASLRVCFGLLVAFEAWGRVLKVVFKRVENNNINDVSTGDHEVNRGRHFI